MIFLLRKRLETVLALQVEKLGYELLDLEFQAGKNSGPAIVRLFIDFFKQKDHRSPIEIDDCVLVDKGLSRFLESEEFESIFSEPFTLEVSSPGVDRPLRKKEHFKQNVGKNAVVKTYRPLTQVELGNVGYHEKNPKQKNFSGTLSCVSGETVFLIVDNEEIGIPFSLISKARLSVSKDIMDLANLEQDSSVD